MPLCNCEREFAANTLALASWRRTLKRSTLQLKYVGPTFQRRFLSLSPQEHTLCSLVLCSWTSPSPCPPTHLRQLLRHPSRPAQSRACTSISVSPIPPCPVPTPFLKANQGIPPSKLHATFSLGTLNFPSYQFIIACL